MKYLRNRFQPSAQSVAGSVAESMAQSMAQPMAQPMAQSMARTIARVRAGLVSAFLVSALLLAFGVVTVATVAPARAATESTLGTSGDLLSALVALQRADFGTSEAYLSRVFAADGGLRVEEGLRSYYFLLSLALGKGGQATELARRLVAEGEEANQLLPYLVLRRMQSARTTSRRLWRCWIVCRAVRLVSLKFCCCGLFC